MGCGGTRGVAAMGVWEIGGVEYVIEVKNMVQDVHIHVYPGTVTVRNQCNLQVKLYMSSNRFRYSLIIFSKNKYLSFLFSNIRGGAHLGYFVHLEVCHCCCEMVLI